MLLKSRGSVTSIRGRRKGRSQTERYLSGHSFSTSRKHDGIMDAAVSGARSFISSKLQLPTLGTAAFGPVVKNRANDENSFVFKGS